MASLDVDSLFTNIPLDETIEIVTKKVFERKRKVNGLSRTDFRRLLSLSTKGTVFLFNGNYYRQKDGVAMGSPLGPVLANAFLCHYETKWIEDCPLAFMPIFYARYVDDIFVLLRSKEHITLLCNTSHRSIATSISRTKKKRTTSCHFWTSTSIVTPISFLLPYIEKPPFLVYTRTTVLSCQTHTKED